MWAEIQELEARVAAAKDKNPPVSGVAAGRAAREARIAKEREKALAAAAVLDDPADAPHAPDAVHAALAADVAALWAMEWRIPGACPVTGNTLKVCRSAVVCRPAPLWPSRSPLPPPPPSSTLSATPRRPGQRTTASSTRQKRCP